MIESLEKQKEAPATDRRLAANFLRWTLKNCPAHAAYLAREGYLEELGIEKDIKSLEPSY